MSSHQQFAAGRSGGRHYNHSRRDRQKGRNGGHRYHNHGDRRDGFRRHYDRNSGNHDRHPPNRRADQESQNRRRGGNGRTLNGNQGSTSDAEHQQRHSGPSSSVRVGHHSHKRGSPHNENPGPQKKPRGLSVNRNDPVFEAIDPEKLNHECPALVDREKWEEKKRTAANEAIKLAIEKDLAKEEDLESNASSDVEDFCSDSSDCSRGKVMGKQPSREPHWLNKLTEPLIDWSSVHLGGFFVKGSIAGADKCCRCFCQDNLKDWRKKKGINVEYTCQPGKNVMDPHGLVDHLKDRKDIVHFAVLTFMDELFKDYYSKGCKHEAFYADQKFALTRKTAYEESIKEKKIAQVNKDKEKTIAQVNKDKEALEDSLDKALEQVRKLEAETRLKDYNDKLEVLKLSSTEMYNRVEKVQRAFGPFIVETHEEDEAIMDLRVKDYSNALDFARAQSNFQSKKDEIGNPKEFLMIKNVPKDDKSGEFMVQSLFDNEYKRFKEEKPSKKDVKRFPLFAKEGNKTLHIVDWVISVQNKVKELEEDHILDDAGGPSNQLLSSVWDQMEALYVSLDEREGARVSLFEKDEDEDEEESSIMPLTDEKLDSKITEAFKNRSKNRKKCQLGDFKEQLMQKAGAYYRAVGLVMFHAIMGGNAIWNSIMPPLFRNVLLRNVRLEKDEGYLTGNVLKLHCVQIRAIANSLPAAADDADQRPRIAKSVQDNFIKTRSFSFDHIRAGLSLDGDFNHLFKLFRQMPPGVISKLFFTKPDVTIKDVQDVMVPEYDPEYPDTLKSQEEVYLWIKEGLPEEKSLLERLNEKGRLCDFLFFVTGSSKLPYKSANSDKITIHFRHYFPNGTKFTADHYPVAGTCNQALELSASLTKEKREEVATKLFDALDSAKAIFSTM